jgi:hypothetical protein
MVSQSREYMKNNNSLHDKIFHLILTLTFWLVNSRYLDHNNFKGVIVIGKCYSYNVYVRGWIMSDFALKNL